MADDKLDVYYEEIFATELGLQAVVETLGEVRTLRRRRDRDKLITYCQSRVEETRQLLNHIMRDLQTRRD